MSDSSLLQLPGELLVLWHLHRAELLISAGVLVAIVRLALYWRSSRSVKPSQPLDSPLSLEKIDGGKILDTPPVQFSQLTKAPLPSSTASKPREARRIKGIKPTKHVSPSEQAAATIQPVIYYFTLGGATKAHAEALCSSLTSTSTPQILAPLLHDLTQLDYDDHFITPSTTTSTSPSTAFFYLLLIPSYNIDSELSNFLSHLQETHHDFRIDTSPLSKNLAGYSVFGFGDRTEWPTEAEGFCVQAVEVDRWMAKLTGGKRAFPLGTGDVKDKDVTKTLQDWTSGVEAILKDLAHGKGLGEGVPGSGDAVESGDEEEEAEGERRNPDGVEGLDAVARTSKPEGRKRRHRAKGRSTASSTADLEDLKAPIPVDFTTTTKSSHTMAAAAPKEMVPVASPTYKALTKQGYTIVGSHSGVKICRWTKSALRGRGSCYKFSFYGIASHRCMEATPALSCSNKCVFCWRHGTNPVGTTWRWQVDPPDAIFAGITDGHYKKIKTLRGVPGVRSERFAEALRIQHCALSLVGEPIFYPHIDALLALLHRAHISSFLVCNAQHPDQLAALGPVTQLYVSVDAADKASLRAIDRPLHRDFWERFLRCMDILHAKRFTHRTVFRLTLVTGFNASLETVAAYADLIARARPSFVEIKGVTYCGTATASGAGLSMANVPFYHEVCAFVRALVAELAARTDVVEPLDYGIAAEHAHSCCVLLADSSRYLRTSPVDGRRRWHTLIDYPKFFQCVESGRPFAPEDYVSDSPTPEWALWGNGGFDPRDQRVDRKGRPKEV